MDFDDQVERLVALGYPQLLGCSAGHLRAALAPLRAHTPADLPHMDLDAGTVGFVVVVNCARAPVQLTLPRVVRGAQPAIERLFPRKPEFFRPIEEAPIPEGHAYLLLGIDRGNASLNAVPREAKLRLAAEGRSPLTMEEGVALLSQWPEFLQPNRCFMMLGSRGGDKRVPALWLSGKQPKLGWCWEGNPHTWLGFASCIARSRGVMIWT
jgi:hypothetical protein